MEVVIAIALIALLMGALMTFFWQTTEIRDKIALSSRRTQIVDQMLKRITDDLRGAVGMDTFGYQGFTQFLGERRKLTFVTTALPRDEDYAIFGAQDRSTRPMPQMDLHEVTYELWIDPEKETDDGDPLVGGILRTERRMMNVAETEADVPEGQDVKHTRRDLWAYEFGYLEFRYFDGVEWSTTFRVTKGNRLPVLVQVTIGFDSLTRKELEDEDLNDYPVAMDQYPLGPETYNVNRFTTIVKMAAADPTFSTRLTKLSDEVEEVYGAQAEEGTDNTGGETGGGQ